MADEWDKYLTTKPKDEWSKYETKAEPGATPETALEEPGLNLEERAIVKSLSGSPEASAEWLRREPGVGGKPKKVGFDIGLLLSMTNPANLAHYLTAKPETREMLQIPTATIGKHEAKVVNVGGRKRIAVRPAGTEEPFKFVDPSHFDVVGDVVDVLPEIGLFGSPGTRALQIGGTMAGIEGGRRMLGRQYGVKEPLEEIAKESALEGAAGAGTAGAINIFGRKFVKPAGRWALEKLGRALQRPAANLEKVTGQAMEQKIGKERDALGLVSERIKAKEGVLAGAKEPITAERKALQQEIQNLRGATQAPLAAKQRAKADLERVKESVISSREKAAEEAKKKIAEMTLSPRTEKELIEVSDDIIANIGKGTTGKGKWDALGLDVLNPATGITAANLRKWPALKELMKKVFGEGAVNDLGSLDMKIRDRWFTRAFEQTLAEHNIVDAQGVEMGKRIWARKIAEYTEGLAKLIQDDPIYKALLKNQKQADAIASLAKGTGGSAERRLLNELAKKMAEVKNKPPELIKALRSYRKTIAPAAEATAKRGARVEEFVKRRGAIAGKERALEPEIAALKALKRSQGELTGSLAKQELQLKAGPKVGNIRTGEEIEIIKGYLGEGLFKSTAQLGKLAQRFAKGTPTELTATLETAPPKAQGWLRKIIRAKERGGIGAYVIIAKALKEPVFRRWAESAKIEIGEE